MREGQKKNQNRKWGRGGRGKRLVCIVDYNGEKRKKQCWAGRKGARDRKDKIGTRTHQWVVGQVREKGVKKKGHRGST